MAQAGIIYIATDDGLVTLSDPGGSGRWRQVGHTLRKHAISAVVASNAMHLLVQTSSGAQQSSDGGMSWQPATETAPLDHRVPRDARVTLQGQPPVMLAVRLTSSGSLALQRSEDSGTTWQTVALTAPLQGTVTVIVTVPHHRDQAWAGTDAGELLHTTDRGRTWQQVLDGLPSIRSLAPTRLA